MKTLLQKDSSPRAQVGQFVRLFILSLGLASSFLLPANALAAFGVTSSGGNYVVDTGGGLVFKIKQSSGDMVSCVYAGKELQDQSKFSHIASGLGTATVTATTYGSSYIKIACSTSTITHYYMARNGFNNVYMATYISAEPSVGELRYICRLSTSTLPNAPATASDIRNNTGSIESSDVFGKSDGTTRSKYYSHDRALELDASISGASGSGVGAYIIYGNRESSSGGPFFRDIQAQTGAQNEIYNYMNSGHNQTEGWRTGLHGPYALAITGGSAPSSPPDFTFINGSGMNLTGYVFTSARGKVVLNGISGRDTSYTYVVGFANSTAQYWVTASSSDGSCSRSDMKPGAYTMTIYKGELAVYSTSVTVNSSSTTTLNTRTITADPANTSVIWRIGRWDGTPNEFLNGQTFITRHPSDSRNADWGPVTFGTGGATNSFPGAQWNDGSVNDPTTVTFNLSSSQVAAHTVKIGITCAYEGGRPQIKVNNWTSASPSASSQPDSRSLTLGTYRGNNHTFTYNVPASAFVSGANTMTINVISGSGTSGFLAAGYGYDCVELGN